MSRFEAHRPGAVDLLADLRFHFVRGGVGDDLGHARPQGALGVDQAGRRFAADQRSPAIAVPLGGQGQVEAGVDARVLLQARHEFGHPGAGHHDAHRVGGALQDGSEGADVRVARHAGIVDVQDDGAGAGGEAEPLGVGLGLGLAGREEGGGQAEDRRGGDANAARRRGRVAAAAIRAGQKTRAPSGRRVPCRRFGHRVPPHSGSRSTPSKPSKPAMLVTSIPRSGARLGARSIVFALASTTWPAPSWRRMIIGT